MLNFGQHAGDESINDPLPAEAPSALSDSSPNATAALYQPVTNAPSAVPPAPSDPSSESMYGRTSPPYTPESPLAAPFHSLQTQSSLDWQSFAGVQSSDSASGALAEQSRLSEPQGPPRPIPLSSTFHYSSIGSATAANRTEFVIAFGSSLPGTVDKDPTTKLTWSVQTVDENMDTSYLSRSAVVSEIMSVNHEDARACRPIELSQILSSYCGSVQPFVVAHHLSRHRILQWYASVAAVVGTRQIVPKIMCPAKRPCRVVTFNGSNSTCSICSHLIYLGSSVARSEVSDFIVCESCCYDISVRHRIVHQGSADSASDPSILTTPSNSVSNLLDLLLCPRAFIPAADNFADDNWHKAMDMWMRSLREVLPAKLPCSAVRPRHIVALENRVSNFRRRIPEPQYHFRVSGLDQSDVCEAMKQIFENRNKINLKLHDAQQGSIENSKLTVLFRHSEQTGQAAGMPANIHSDGITPVMYSILALEFSNPMKYAGSMWLPSCCIDGEVAPCGLFPRPFIPDPSPTEIALQRETVDRFLLLGRCIGIALRDRRVFMLPLSLAFADALCGTQLTLWDTCLGEIDLQENDGCSANRSVLHAIEHCHDVAVSMVFRGQTLSNQRIDVPISETSFGSPDDFAMRDISATIIVDDSGTMFVNVSKDVLQHVQELCKNDDPAYVTFSGEIPPGLSAFRAYKVQPANDHLISQLKVLDARADCAGPLPMHAQQLQYSVSIGVMRVYSSCDGAGDRYLRSLEVPQLTGFFSFSFNLHFSVVLLAKWYSDANRCCAQRHRRIRAPASVGGICAAFCQVAFVHVFGLVRICAAMDCLKCWV